jgi:hypothetical protein
MSEPNGGTQGQGGREVRPIVVRGRITKINAEKYKDAPISGIELGVEFDQLKANGQFLEVWFTYHAFYKEEVGHITMSGFLIFEMDEVTVKRHAERFEQKRDFDPGFAEAVVNNINYKCSTDAIFPAKVIELTAPIVPPRIGLLGGTGRPQQGKQDAAAAPPPEKKAPATGPDQKPAAQPPITTAKQAPGRTAAPPAGAETPPTPQQPGKKMYDTSPFMPQSPFSPKTPPPFKK